MLSDLIDAIRGRKAARATPSVLRLVAAWDDEPLRLAAAKALGDVVTAEQAPALREALAKGDVPVRVAAVKVLAKVVGNDGKDEIAEFLSDKTEAVALAAATALADQGDRRALGRWCGCWSRRPRRFGRGASAYCKPRRASDWTSSRLRTTRLGKPPWRNGKRGSPIARASAELNVPLKYLSQSMGRILLTDARNDRRN